MTAPYRLVLLRHGESEWNAKNLFTGWVDVPLNDKGRAEAARGADLLRERELLPEVLHTSVLRRAIRRIRCLHAGSDAVEHHWSGAAVRHDGIVRLGRGVRRR